MTTDIRDDWGGLEVHPGYTLRQEIAETGMSQRELAARMGRPEQVVSDIINGRKSITVHTAKALETVLGIPMTFWVNLQRQHDLARARVRERTTLEAQTPRLKDFHYNQLVKRGWVKHDKDRVEQVRILCKFLGVASLNNHAATVPASFRITGSGRFSDETLAVWLRRGELLARDMELPSFDRAKFHSILPEIRRLTTELPSAFYPRMVDLCTTGGVAFVVVEELPKVGANGAVRWLHTGNPLIQLNLKWKWADIFWFTFFHEAGHVMQPKRHEVLHYTRRRHAHDMPYEAEADDFARDTLIPPHHWQHIKDEAATSLSGARVRELAHEVGIDPGIIVGRLQHERIIRHSELSELRTQYEWTG